MYSCSGCLPKAPPGERAFLPISPSRKDNPLGTWHRGRHASRESLLEVWVLTGQS